MTHFKFFLLISTVIFLSAFTINSAMSWNIEEGHSINFSTKKANGDFQSFTGDIQFDENNLLASTFDVQIDVNSIRTGNFMKNSHAKGKNWFNAKDYPTINFTSNNFSTTANGYEVTGVLEIRGIQKEITMPFTFSDQSFRSSFTVDRTDFNIGKTTGMAKSVGNDITLDITVPVTK